jgi:Protein of unknown function (DUF2523)
MSLTAWLFAILSPAIARIMVALGFSVVTITGLDAAISSIKSSLTANLGGLPTDMLQIFHYAGGGIGLGMILGALATRLMIIKINSSMKILGVTPS